MARQLHWVFPKIKQREKSGWRKWSLTKKISKTGSVKCQEHVQKDN